MARLANRRAKTTLVKAGLLMSLAGAATSAQATWSIVLVDVRTGEVAIGSATCLTNRDLQASTPAIITGLGGGTAQSAVDTTGQNRIVMRDGIALGTNPPSIISTLATFDSTGHQSRQYGIVDTQGRFTTFSGTGDGKWAGGRTGTFTTTYLGKTSTIAYAIQGNVLTGAPVVDAAVAAARDTVGDLPAKLLAAMEAARSMGGDGRCSCDETAADSCGAPPPTFTKSAHVGYVISARAGDVDYSHGIYRTDTNTQVITAADTDGDGKPEIITGPISSNVLDVLKNVTPAGLGMAIFAPQVRTATAGTIRGLASADFNRDGKGDVIVGGWTFNKVSLHRGSADGVLSSRSDFITNSSPGPICAADFDGINGPEFAVANVASNNIAVRYNTGSGGMGLASSYAGNADQRAIVAANVAGDAKPDVVVLSAGAPEGPKIAVLRSDGTTFTALPDTLVPANPLNVVAGDFDRDGRIDLAVLHGAPTPTITVLRNVSDGVFIATSVPLPVVCNDVAVGDMNRDGNLDLVVTRNDQQLQIFNGSGTGTFTPGPISFVGQSLNKIVLADFNVDGMLDAAMTTGVNGAVAVVGGKKDGSFWSGTGAAMGEYFMDFNMPDGTDGSPDPVFVLQGRFDAWRSALVGRPDAVQSIVETPTVFEGSAANVRVTVRDWQGNIIPASSGLVLDASLSPRAGGNVSTINGVSIDGDAFLVSVSGLSNEGTDALVLKVRQDGARDIQIMPKPQINVIPCPADFDGSGGTPDISDIDSFVVVWLAGNAAADVDRSGGTPDSTDIQVFFDAWLAGGC